MQLKLFVSLFVLGLAAAATVGQGKTVHVSGDHHVEVTSQKGQEVKIVKDGEHYVITLNAPNVEEKTVRIHDQHGGDLVYDILAKHEGAVDNAAFETILKKVEEHVQKNEVNAKFYYALQFLDDEHAIQYFDRDHQDEHGVHHQGESFNQHGHHNGKAVHSQAFYGQHRGYYGPHYYTHHQETPYYGQHHYGQQYYGQHQGQGKELVEDILHKEARIEALTFAQEKFQVVKDILAEQVEEEKEVLHQHQGAGYGYQHQYGSQYPRQYGSQYSHQYGSEYPQQYDSQHQYGSQYKHQYGSQYPQQYGSQYQHQYGSQYPHQYASEYKHQYGSQYPHQYGSQYQHQYGSQYPHQYGGEYEQQYESQYPQQYGGEYEHQYGSQYPRQSGSGYQHQYGSQYGHQYGSQYPHQYGYEHQYNEVPRAHKSYGYGQQERLGIFGDYLKKEPHRYETPVVA